MNFVINTNYKESAGTIVLKGLERRLIESDHVVSLNDWSNYHKYEVVIFMAPDSKVKIAKAKNPKILSIIFDPKITLSWQVEEVKSADILVVSSIEQRDALLKYNKNIFIYYMFPDTPEIKKEHIKKDKIIIGYHGNKQHLDAMADVSWALDELSKKYPIELLAIYNIEKLGKWTKNAPTLCPVKHVQWVKENFNNDLSVCDIGIVPSVLPAPKFFSRPWSSFFYNREGYHSNDYVQRFKFSNNPGRIYVFSQLHIPVVTDFTPSACQIIKDGESGFLVGAKEGWANTIEQLIVNHDLRNTLRNNLKKNIDTAYSIELNFSKFLDFLNFIYASKQ